MKLRMTAVVLLALAPAGAYAQEQRDAVCPTVTVSCPDGPNGDKTVTYTAVVKGGDPSVTPTYNWTVKGGKISSGQGTHEIVVEVEGGNSLAAAVEVGGYLSSCQATAACTISIDYARIHRKVDEYGDIKPNEEKERLGSFAQELRNDPTAQGYVIVYAGRRARRGEALERGEKARNYLVGGWGLDAVRIVVIDGGHREERAVELFVVPTGASPPPATPIVAPSEVEIIEDGTRFEATVRHDVITPRLTGR